MGPVEPARASPPVPRSPAPWLLSPGSCPLAPGSCPLSPVPCCSLPALDAFGNSWFHSVRALREKAIIHPQPETIMNEIAVIRQLPLPAGSVGFAC